MAEPFDVVIVGGGFSGLLCGHYLKKAGIENFCILEMGSSLGGVWQNGGVGGHPGAACDVPSYAPPASGRNRLYSSKSTLTSGRSPSTRIA